MSFGELCVVVILAIVVIGPKELPRYLRKAGQLSGKLRRMASDVRAQSGIDEVLRSEGLTKDIAEIRSLAAGDFIRGPNRPAAVPRMSETSAVLPTVEAVSAEGLTIVREREYPREGADSYGAMLDTAIVYTKGLPASPLAKDPLYVVGDADAPLPPPEPEPDLEPSDEPPAPDAAPPEEGGLAAPSVGHA